MTLQIVHIVLILHLVGVFKMKIEIATFEHEDGTFEVVEFITKDKDYFIRDMHDCFVVQPEWLNRITVIGSIYDIAIDIEGKGEYNLFKFNRSANYNATMNGKPFDIGSYTMILRHGYGELLQEGIAFKIQTFKGEWYRTNIVTAIEIIDEYITDFYTLSGSKYRLMKGD